MKYLELPKQLEGWWEHALILTYGVDIPFFEHALWRQFSATCRNIIILADGRRFLEACRNYARGVALRGLNQQYVGEGIFARHAAHAKLILLANQEQGRLLVGSGNLGMQGYAGGGELFTQYEYTAAEPEMLNAFLSIRELVEGLMTRGYVTGGSAQRRLARLFNYERVPWLFHPASGETYPIRHNLEHNLLDQVMDLVGGDPVEELWIHAPFYDAHASALEQMLNKLQPHRAIVLVQSGRTSVDPLALRRIQSSYGNFEVHPFTMGEHNPYVHAKLYLIKMPGRAVCLQGSPNLSHVAMLLADPSGNIEIASLLEGARDAFDEILDAFDIQPEPSSLEDLDLSYEQPERLDSQLSTDGCFLTGGEWHDDQLHLSYRGSLPSLQNAELLIRDEVFSLNVYERDAQILHIRISPEVTALLKSPVPVSLRWGTDESLEVSNQIFVCNRAALASALQSSDETEKLDRVGDLDLEDKELEQLLGELDAALVIDQHNAWQLIRGTSSSSDDVEDAPLIAYGDVDYELLRKHPKLLQYLSRGLGTPSYQRSRLQIILSSITDHFRGVLGPVQLLEVTSSSIGQDTAETEEERLLEEEDRERHRRTGLQRIRQILTNFIRRYMRGLQSPGFQRLAGFEVIAQNYIIFSHILWRLFAKDWLEPEIIVDFQVQVWTFFWGSENGQGYFDGLEPAQQGQVLEWFEEHHTDAQLLASIFYSAFVTRTLAQEKLRFVLRSVWRRILQTQPFVMAQGTLEETWHIVAHLIPYDTPTPSGIASELSQLAQFETQQSFLRALEARQRYQQGSCTFSTANVWSNAAQRDIVARCLVIPASEALSNLESARDILQQWMSFEPRLSYYRIATPDCNRALRLLFYEPSISEGTYLAKDQTDKEIELGYIAPFLPDWGNALDSIKAQAKQLDAQIALTPQRIALTALNRGPASLE